MKKITAFFIPLFCLTLHVEGQTKRSYKAGDIVDKGIISEVGVDNFFHSDTITAEVWQRIWKKSFKENCTVPRQNLLYLKVIHANGEGQAQVGEMICNKLIAADLLKIFKQLYAINYPIERMVLVDNYDADDERSMAANNTSCFNFRAVIGTTKLSHHSRGMAVDINPLYNPCVHTRTGLIEPANGRPYAYDRKKKTAKFPIIDHDDPCYKLFTSYGFEWGGNWTKNIDYQHFEK